MNYPEIIYAIGKGFALVGILFAVLFTLFMVSYLAFTAWLSLSERNDDEGLEEEQEEAR